MATSPEAFQKVKQILQKLDRSIDSARDRRLAGSPVPAPAPAAAPKIDPEAAPKPLEAGPLRARPMRTPDHQPPSGVWNAPTGTDGHAGR